MARQDCHALGMTDIREAELVLLGPEKRDGVKPLPPTKDVTRQWIALGFGVVGAVLGTPTPNRCSNGGAADSAPTMPGRPKAP